MVKANSGRFLRPVEIKGCHCLPDVLAQRVPVVSLRDDGFGQALCNKASVTFLCDLEDNLVHALQITALGLQWQGRRDRSLAERELRRLQVQRTPSKDLTARFLLDRTAGGSLSRVQLLAEVILQAHLFDQVELGFEEIDVIFLVFKESLEEIG